MSSRARRFRAVHQFHSGTAQGDAITQQMIFLRRCLRDLDYESEIFAEHIPGSLADEINPVSVYRPTSDDLLLVHHSIGHTAMDVLLGFDVPIVTIYHSITPAPFFDDASIRYFVRQGEHQLRLLAKHSVAAVADSNFNRQEMYDAGFRSVSVMPVRTDFRAAHEARSARSGLAHKDWLYVGRVVPNKRQVELVRAFAAFHWTFDRAAQLRLVGDLSLGGYVEAVRNEAALLGVEANVRVLGKVTERELWSEYSNAGLFVSLSEHEGFGVPLLEAMAAGVPVIARSAAAVPETMGGAGILVEDTDPRLVAAIAQVVETDVELRERIVAHQTRPTRDHRGLRRQRVSRRDHRRCFRCDTADDGPDPGSVRDQLQPRDPEPRARTRISPTLVTTCRSTRPRAPATTDPARTIWNVIRPPPACTRSTRAFRSPTS